MAIALRCDERTAGERFGGHGVTENAGVLVHLPADLQYLTRPALRYGRYQFDNDIFSFLDRASEVEMEDLASVAERVLLNNDYPRVNAFLDRYPITDSDQAACLYFLFLVMDYADLKFDRVSESDS